MMDEQPQKIILMPKQKSELLPFKQNDRYQESPRFRETGAKFSQNPDANIDRWKIMYNKRGMK